MCAIPMLPPLTRCPRPPQVAAYCVSAATSAFWLTLLIKLNWHALPLLHFAQALTTQRFCRRTPYLMGKFWVMLKWYLLITFVGSVCGAIGWSFRSTAGGLNYLLSDPILKVRIARVLQPTTRVIPLSESAEQGSGLLAAGADLGSLHALLPLPRAGVHQPVLVNSHGAAHVKPPNITTLNSNRCSIASSSTLRTSRARKPQCQRRT